MRLLNLRPNHPTHLVISYMKLHAADIKAIGEGIICTSADAVSIVRQIPPGSRLFFAKIAASANM
jgi:quinolinate synthase